MSVDPARRDNALAWLAKARQDLARVRRCLADSPPDNEDALFHCQQASEKALKALLAWHDEPFRKTHDLSVLGKQCAALQPDLALLLARLDDLSEYAWIFRYPGEFVVPEQPEVRDAQKLAEDIVEAVARRSTI
ncbi:MAG TPA: HEPN domain-containing protein [Bryobacteraceae bacterium]|nr:HEPN domain-containing protein [Bryobacteraceae bacterium]